jgi:TRAP transporter 4TM/12TM fusion protein
MSNNEKDVEKLSIGDVPAAESLAEEQVQRLVEKYDTESRYRRLTGWQGLWFPPGVSPCPVSHVYGRDRPSSHGDPAGGALTFALAAVFLLYPASPKLNRTKIPWYDWILAALAVVGTGYIVFFFNEIARRGARPLSSDVVLGVLTIALVLEAGRRIVGKVLPTLSFLFLLYCAFGRYAPGMFMHRGYSLSRIIQHMYLTPEGLFGVALGVSATFVFMFILFGAFLSRSGGARFFNELSLAVAGHSPGGPAKVAIVASGLLGTINGSSVANVATTGAFTIPLMKRVGYLPEYAGAVEACASTGGSSCPPSWGRGPSS